MQKNSITLAVLSDLHAAPRTSDPKGIEIKLYSDGDTFALHENPLTSLHQLIDEEKLHADFVVCPGDMTNRADGGALRFVWGRLHDLKARFGAAELIATVGNHDVDSRSEEVGTVPRESLMRLTPRFPIGDDALSDHFWAHGYYITIVGKVRFLVLNSSWLHEHKKDLEKGAVTSYTLEKLRRDLKLPCDAEFNIAVCHHHPHVHSDLNLGNDIMTNGQSFLDALSQTGAWLVVHGHKHHPKIEAAQGDYQRPFVLACGSFSGRLEGPNATVSKNYFHMVEVEKFGEDQELRGVITSWEWVSGLGWKCYGTANTTFPSRLGFGFEGSLQGLAKQIASIMEQHKLKRWNEMIKISPDLAHLTPRKFEALKVMLSDKYKILVTCDDTGLPSEFGIRSL